MATAPFDTHTMTRSGDDILAQAVETRALSEQLAQIFEHELAHNITIDTDPTLARERSTQLSSDPAVAPPSVRKAGRPVLSPLSEAPRRNSGTERGDLNPHH